MSDRTATPVIYEVTLEVDPTIAADYDTWLEAHLRKVLEQDGFESGHVFRSNDTVADGWQRRIVQYHVRSATDLDRYLENDAPALRSEGVARWGERFRASRRILTPASELATPSASGSGDTVTECPNCSSLNIEKFCANCGQSNRVSVVAFPRLVADLLTDLFNFDARMFASLWPLLARPGVLTKEFLAGRRASYLPPVRMYLFLSLFFFGIVALLAPNDIKFDDANEIKFDDDGAKPATEKAEIDYSLDQGLKDVASEADRKAAADAARKANPPPPDTTKVAGGEGWGIRVDDDDGASVELTDAETGFLKRAEDRATQNVQRLNGPGAEEYRATLLRRGIGHLPWLMFLLLPIYALFLKLLYVRSGRYYVEHLIYSLHLHSFIFLTLGALFAWLGVLDAMGYQSAVHPLVWAAWWIYFVLYPWFAMKRVYGQGKLKTAAKYLILGLFYIVLLAFGLVFAVIFTLST